MNSRRSDARRERGAALIVALLVVAMVVMLATALSSDFLYMFRRVENQLYSEQAYAYLRGAEALSRAALLYDLQKDDKDRNDNLAEDWAQPQQYPTDYGWIGGQLEDLQGRFNLNTLPLTKKLQPGEYSKEQWQFIRLLLALKLEEPMSLDQAEALTDAVTDWIDRDSDVNGLGGAESQFYESADPPGRPANRPLVGPSELMLVKGMTPEIYRALAPLVTVWPALATNNAININTAPVEVLRSLGADKDPQPLSEGEIDALLEARKAPKFISDGDKAALLGGGVLANRKIDMSSVVVKSDYFLLNTITDFEGHRYAMRSILHRTSEGKKRVDVIARTFGDW
ncbi:MAG TPA: type II secretion system minor pseudopilin GspK [Spongiibacteraceae bacterium]|nr:type II secretion system minor pseudopilin GspK [Spongiibacteraceae bacterium]